MQYILFVKNVIFMVLLADNIKFPELTLFK
jgi:hypothetical protein